MLEEAGGKASVLELWEGDGREEEEEERGSRLATDPKENYDVCRSETSSLGVSLWSVATYTSTSIYVFPIILAS